MERFRPGDQVEHNQALTQLEHSLFGRVGEPVKLSRYRLVEKLGGGGGGTTFTAHDPDLDRTVAVKLVRRRIDPSEPTGERDRLLSEARALAGVSHPNVVTVHDVGVMELDTDEADTDGGRRNDVRVFMVLEHVDGVSLDEWLARRRQGWRRVVGLFVAAGRGLQAVHDAGLVHRDFKPSNVLVGLDGRVRLSDFGLVCASTAADELAVRTSRIPDSRESGPIAAATTTGAVQGTPLYMSPEQHEGGPIDARSDQFGFCASLWEALHGIPPWRGSSRGELARAKRSDPPAVPADGPRVPKRVRRTLLRGLAADPDGRYASLAELLAELERALTARRRETIGVGLSFAVAAPLVVAALIAREPTTCDDPRKSLAGIWDDAVRASISDAFAASELPFAERTWGLAEAGLERYAGEWAEARSKACEASVDPDERTRQAAAQQIACLDRRLRDLAAVSGVLREPDQDVVARAPDFLDRLRRVDACLSAPPTVDIPESPEDRRRLVELETAIARARAMYFAGKYREAFALVESAMDKAGQVQPASEARGLVLRGNIETTLGNLDAAEQDLTRGLARAEEAADEEVAANALLGLMHVVGVLRARRAEGLRLAEQVAAKIERGKLDSSYSARLEHGTGNIELNRGQYERAFAHYERVLELCEEGCRRKRHLTRVALVGMGNVRTKQARYAEARTYYETYLRRLRDELGDQHPRLEIAYNNLGMLAVRLGDYDQALRRYLQALELYDKALSKESPGYVRLLHNIAEIDIMQDRLDEAERRLEEAQKTIESTPSHSFGLYMILAMRARVEEARGHKDRAIELFERALEDCGRERGPSHMDTLNKMHRLGNMLCETGRGEEGLAYNREALSRRREALGDDHPHVALSENGVGMCLVALGRHEEAVEQLQEASERWEKARWPQRHRARRVAA
jgi:serine/threonine protein kinase/Tfp pilus assembly protein PilF